MTCSDQQILPDVGERSGAGHIAARWTIGSLFSGIGGLELGLEWADLGRVVWQVEQDAFCRRVLEKHWPDADRSVTDVRRAGSSTLVAVDLICGGFPCQDVSGAGRGAGLDGPRSGLWWEFHRVVAELRPRGVVVENVASGARRWLCPVRRSLHQLGYRTRALGVSAADVGAPHLRKRIFVVADSDCQRGVESEGAERDERRRPADGGAPVGDASGKKREGTIDTSGAPRGRVGTRLGEAECGVGRGANGVPSGLDGHRASADSSMRTAVDMHWPAGRGEAQHPWEPPRAVTERIPNRRARVKALGNAVVPQCAYVVGLVVRQLLVELPR